MHTMFFLLIYTPFPAKSLQAELLQLPRGCSGGMEREIWPLGSMVTATHRRAAQKGSGAGSRLPKYSISDGSLDSKDLGKTTGE